MHITAQAPVSKMTYTVSSGTLNCTIPYLCLKSLVCLIACILSWQGEFEMENLNDSNNSESLPMMGEPVTVQPGREADTNQPIVLQPRSSGDSPYPRTDNTA